MTENLVTETLFPAPKRERWQPLRSGLINLFHYADEQFWYEDGRMLLRGNNGTGKSRVLALQLPFLLDAEVSPLRMEPDRSPSKRPEWNLLLGGKHRERLGYTWIEFGRLDEEGQAVYFTLGCGLHAVEHRSGVDAWFFTTPERVGQDFALVDDAVPLSRSRLNEVLGEAGQVYRTQGDYRRAVEERLFKLGSRYRSLIDLLIQLRVPQLSRDFDEKRMNAQLSEALPPLSADVLTQVADAMRDLDEERERLEELRRSAASVQQFRDQYRRYLRIAIKRRVVNLSDVHNRYERTLRTMNEDRQRLDEAQQAVQEAEQQQAAAESVQTTIRATLSALRSRPEMHDAQRLEDLRAYCEQLRGSASDAHRDADRTKEDWVKAKSLADDEAKILAHQTNQTQTSIDQLVKCELPDTVREPFLATVADLIDEHAPARRLAPMFKTLSACAQGIETLKRHEVQLTQRSLTLTRQLDQQLALEEQLDEQQQLLSERTDSLRAAQTSLQDALLAWFDAATILATDLPSRGEWMDLIAVGEREAVSDEFVDEPDLLEINPLDAVSGRIEKAAEMLRSRLADERQHLSAAAQQLRDSISTWEADRQRLMDGVHTPPPAPHVRDAAARTNRQGGPLYELCEFVDEIPDAERPNWEAALEASGLLDAWVTLDGRLDDPQLADATLLAGDPLDEPHTRLTCVLRVAETLPPEMSADVVTSLLASIGCGRNAATAWVDRDGTWQVGPATGAWTKREVQHIGAAAREARRQRQIELLAEEIASATLQLSKLEAATQSLDDDRRQIKAALDVVPTNESFKGAIVRRLEAAAQLLKVQQRLDEKLEQVGQARTELAQAERRRDRDADDLGLSAWVERLAELEKAITDFRQGLELLQRDLDNCAQRRTALDRYRQRRHAAEELAKEKASQAQQADSNWSAKKTQLKTLEENVGADVKKILADIAVQEQREVEVGEELKKLQSRVVACAQERGRLEGKLGESRQMLDLREADRTSAISRLAALADQGLARQAMADAEPPFELPETPWSATRAAQLAKQMRAELSDVPDSDNVWDQSQNEMQVQFRGLEQALLPTGVTPQSQTHDEIAVVTVPFQGVVCSPADLARQMADEVRHREVLITDRERELFEQRLIGDIAQALHRNIRDAHELCTRMNQEVESRPMSTGMRLRFRWGAITDGSDELKVACKVLLRQPSAMNEDDRGALGMFLQQRIQEARSRDDAGTWQQHLADALDYRGWFTFDIERQTDGRWQRLTRRTHGTGSGGERAVALIIPMLAALAAYYHSADKHAPRIILMDEAFVGIDNEMRAKFMDLMVQFDLDFVMTSEREWGCYPTMPSLAIYHLSTRRGVDAILPTRWVWNGILCEQSDVHEPVRQQTLFETET